MRKAGLLLVLAGWMIATAFAAEIPDGIPRTLAQERAARVSDIRYSIGYKLVPHAATTEATETIRFRLTDAGTPLLLDFRDGRITTMTLNGAAVAAASVHGHLTLPPAALRAGENTIEAGFTANIGTAGKAITRFEDRDDGSEYLYTLFVPMDADMAFPCFDQPDLKGRFTLKTTEPSDWSVISNTKASRISFDGKVSTTAFPETEPISTYLFAFAAGPFVNVHPRAGLPNVWVRKSQVKNAADAIPAVQETAAEGMQFLAKYFDEPFPFPKYEMVLIPGFAYGGMEHAGATFLREESVIFRTAPTAINRLNRDVVVLHELTHQWFGDATTMRWFDDLWLKEGFAQYMAYKTLAALRPGEPIWQRFYQSIKPAAYGIDETQGTTPIYQDIPNLNDAKSAYGAIVYEKAPGVLRQLNYVIGDAAFQKGLQIYLAQHEYGNATWSDLIGAFQTASGRDLSAWAEMWIRHRGMPRITVDWNCAHGRLAVRLSQTPELGGDDAWPIATELALGYADGRVEKVRADLPGTSAEVQFGREPMPCPAWVFANNDDHAYGLFLLDAKSRAAVMQQVAAMPDLFRRTMLWGALWDSVREAQLDPADYTRLALDTLPREQDESLLAATLAHTERAIHRYLPSPAPAQGMRGQTQALFLTRAQNIAVESMMNAPSHDLRIVWFRSLPGFAETTEFVTPSGAAVMKDLLAGTRTIPGVTLRQQDRWELVTAQLAYGDPQADAVLAAEEKRDPSGDGRKFAYVAQAARPDAATKARYFDDYLHNTQISEDWIQSSLGAFNFWNQSRLTAPYVQPALEALEQVKRERKIFFLVAWLDAFLDGQQSQASLDVVEKYLATAQPDPDLRLKILQAVDELQRTVRIRAKWTGGPL